MRVEQKKSVIRQGYPSDVDDGRYFFLLPYLLLSRQDARQRKYPIRDVLNALFWIARTGAQRGYLPNDFPPPETVRQQAHRWFEAGCFETAAHDLRILSWVERSSSGEPTAIIMDSRTLQSMPESGHRAGFDGAKERKGTKVHLAVDTLGHLLAVLTIPANEQDPAQVKDLCPEVQEATGVSVEVAFADQGYTGEQTALHAADAGVALIGVKRPEASKGFMLRPRRWVVERSFAWLSRFGRLGRDLDRLPSTLVGFHFLAACVLLCHNLKPLFAQGSWPSLWAVLGLYRWLSQPAHGKLSSTVGLTHQNADKEGSGLAVPHPLTSQLCNRSSFGMDFPKRLTGNKASDSDIEMIGRCAAIGSAGR